MVKHKKTPMRKCIGCQTSKAKTELCRIVKDNNGVISFDGTGRKNGRGAYVCPNVGCLQAVWKGHKLEKEFEMHIENETYQELIKQVESHIEKLGGGAIGQ